MNVKIYLNSQEMAKQISEYIPTNAMPQLQTTFCFQFLLYILVF